MTKLESRLPRRISETGIERLTLELLRKAKQKRRVSGYQLSASACTAVGMTASQGTRHFLPQIELAENPFRHHRVGRCPVFGYGDVVLWITEGGGP